MRSLTKGIAQNVPVRFIIFLGRKILRLDRLFNLINRQEYSSTLRTCILHIPLVRPLFYLVYHLLLNAMIVKPRGHSLWLVKLPGGPAWLTPDLSDAIDHITVIWRRGIEVFMISINLEKAKSSLTRAHILAYTRLEHQNKWGKEEQ
jgi:hypothetical protein